MLILTGQQVTEVLPIKDAVESAAAAYRALGSDRTLIPERMHLGLVSAGIDNMLVMPGYLDTTPASVGLKLATITVGNRDRGLPVVYASMLLVDPDTGAPLCLLDGSVLTAIRTGASGGLAARYLARGDSRTATVIGAGVQSRTLLQAVAGELPLVRVRVFDLDRERALQFSRDMAAQLGLDIEVRSDPLIGDSDVILCATTAADPVFPGRDVAAGTFVAGIGSYRPEMRELDEDILLRADKIVVDTREGVLAEAGDLSFPIAAGRLSVDSIHSDMHQLVAGIRPGRERADEITVYKAVGHACLDLAAAHLAYDRARALGIGTEVSL